MKVTKEQAKQEIDVYGTLLMERAVITDITTTNVRDETHYNFEILEKFDFPYPIECVGVKELALVLKSMWLSYAKAWNDSGFELQYSIYIMDEIQDELEHQAFMQELHQLQEQIIGKFLESPVSTDTLREAWFDIKVYGEDAVFADVLFDRMLKEANEQSIA